MFKSRRSLSLLLSALVVFSASVFLFDQKAYAQEPLPLPIAQEVIEKQKQEVDNKTSILIGSEQEIQNLVAKKESLANELDAIKGDLEKLKNEVSEKKAAAERERKRVAELKNMFVHINRYAAGASGNLYTPGNCTWYVKSKRPDLPNNLGNADTWYARAAAQGWNVGLTPKKGAAGQSVYGMHVVYVEGVSLDGQYVTISEMNYRGLYSMNTRTVHYTEFKYIYELD